MKNKFFVIVYAVLTIFVLLIAIIGSLFGMLFMGKPCQFYFDLKNVIVLACTTVRAEWQEARWF